MDNRDLSPRQIGMAFTGSILGAGFISGQELMQFFGVFGYYGILGMVISIVLFSFFGSFVMKVARRTGTEEFDKIIVKDDIPWLRGIFSMVFLLFLFGIITIMLAGAGALLDQLFNIPKILGNLLTGIALGLVALWGVKAVLKAFSIIVPLLILVGVITSLLSFFTFKDNIITGGAFSGTNPFLGNWVLSMIAFVSYNMMAAIAILVPIANGAREEKIIDRGILRGIIQFTIVFASILLPIVLNLGMLLDKDLPMVTLAKNIHPILGWIYGVLLYWGMFGSGLSCLYGVTLRIKKYREMDEKVLTIALVGLAFFGSIAGFKELISILFPIFGYIGFFGLIGILLHYISIKRESKIAIQIREE